MARRLSNPKNIAKKSARGGLVCDFECLNFLFEAFQLTDLHHKRLMNWQGARSDMSNVISFSVAFTKSRRLGGNGNQGEE